MDAATDTVLAQNSQCNGSLTILSQSDASSIQSCRTYQGSVTISPNATGAISLNGIAGITGDLTCNGATQLTSLSADQLGTIGGTFDLQGLTIMSSLSMSSLRNVNSIRWITLPALQQLSFPQGVSQANNVYISDTALTTLRGIELTAVGRVDINNNQYLKTINVNALTNVTTSLAFSANGPNLDIEFPNLGSAANLTFRDVSSISLPSLNQVPGAMGFYSNAFTSFSAPNLTAVGGTIAFVNSPNLANLTMPSLTYVGGGLQLANNSRLASINGFNALAQIGGDINFYGTFDSVSFSSLTNVRGAANVITSSQNSSLCKLFTDAKSRQIIKGNVNCRTNTVSSQTNGSSSSGSGTSSSNAAVAPSFSIATSFTGLAAVVVAAALFA